MNNSLDLLRFILKDHNQRLPLSFWPCDFVILSMMFHELWDNISDVLTMLHFCQVLHSYHIGGMAPRRCKTWQQLKPSLALTKRQYLQQTHISTSHILTNPQTSNFLLNGKVPMKYHPLFYIKMHIYMLVYNLFFLHIKNIFHLIPKLPSSARCIHPNKNLTTTPGLSKAWQRDGKYWGFTAIKLAYFVSGPQLAFVRHFSHLIRWPQVRLD